MSKNHPHRQKAPSPSASRKAKLLWALTIALLSVGVVGSGLFWGISTLVSNRRNAQLDYELKTVRTDLTNGHVADAKARFSLLNSKLISDMGHAFAFLKTAWQISRATDDFSLLEKHSKQLYPRFRRNQDMAALYTYALLRTRQYTKAFAFARGTLSKGEYASLLAESYLKFASAAARPKALEALPSEERALIELTQLKWDQLDLLIPNYESLLTAIDDPRLAQNLVLLYCAKGDYAKAWPLALQFVKSSSPELFAQVAVDSHQDQEALSVLYPLIRAGEGEPYPSRRICDFRLTVADILLRQHEISEAVAVYRDFVEARSDFSVVPYRNLLALVADWTAAEKEAARVSDSQLLSLYTPLFENKVPFSDVYTQDVELILSFAQLLARTDHSLEAKNLLTRYLQTDPDNAALQLLLYSLSDSSRPDFFVSQLTYLMQNDPSNELIPKTLCHYLIAFPDRGSQLREVLTLSETVFSNEPWFRFYRAYAAALTQKPAALETAAADFAALYAEAHEWEYAFNAAQIDLFLRRSESALQYAHYAETALLSTAATDTFPLLSLKIAFGKVKALQGAVLEQAGKKVDAVNAYEAAKQYDPGNLNALLALEKLTAEPEP